MSREGFDFGKNGRNLAREAAQVDIRKESEAKRLQEQITAEKTFKERFFMHGESVDDIGYDLYDEYGSWVFQNMTYETPYGSHQDPSLVQFRRIERQRDKDILFLNQLLEAQSRDDSHVFPPLTKADLNAIYNMTESRKIIFEYMKNHAGRANDIATLEQEFATLPSSLWISNRLHAGSKDFKILLEKFMTIRDIKKDILRLLSLLCPEKEIDF